MQVVRVNFCVCSVEKSYVKKLFTLVSSYLCMSFQNNALIVSYCFCLFGEFAKVFERSSIELIVSFQNNALIVSYCFCSFGEFAKVFERSDEYE